ncbi:MAG: Hpt domain-containing protein [Alphaproteobacteria bacterium]
MAEKDAEFIVPPNRIKSKVTYNDSGVDMAALARAEQVIANLQGNYLQWVEDDLTNLQAAYEKARAEPDNRKRHLDEVFRIAHDVKGQGGSFGYHLMTIIANQLCRTIEKYDATRDDVLEVVKLHIHALRLVISQRMEGDGGAAGASLVKGLEAVISKVAAR